MVFKDRGSDQLTTSAPEEGMDASGATEGGQNRNRDQTNTTSYIVTGTKQNFGYGSRNKRLALAVVLLAMDSRLSPRSSAIRSATAAT